VTTTDNGLTVRSKVWFVIDELHAFGSGLAGLLEGIDRLGTLSQAALGTGMSYRYAWKLIKNAEKHAGTRLTVPQPGGAGGGRSKLSADGRQFLAAFQRISQEVASFADSRFRELGFKMTKRPGGVPNHDRT